MIRWLAILLLLSGCTTERLEIPRAPQWIQPASTERYNALAIINQVQLVAPGAYTQFSDSTYTPLSAKWVRAYTSWTWGAAKAIGLHYTPESFDCENFAGLFNEIARKKAADAGITAAPLIARVTVELAPGKLHAIVGAATDEGILLIEPQPDAGPFRITPIKDYKPKILRVEL